MAKKAEVEGTPEISQDSLHGGEVRLTEVVHVEAHLLDGVGDVEAGEGEVLESPDESPVGRRVIDRVVIVVGDLRLSVNRHGVGLVV